MPRKFTKIPKMFLIICFIIFALIGIVETLIFLYIYGGSTMPDNKFDGWHDWAVNSLLLYVVSSFINLNSIIAIYKLIINRAINIFEIICISLYIFKIVFFVIFFK